jgi:hypothetical protein
VIIPVRSADFWNIHGEEQPDNRLKFRLTFSNVQGFLVIFGRFTQLILIFGFSFSFLI